MVWTSVVIIALTGLIDAVGECFQSILKLNYSNYLHSVISIYTKIGMNIIRHNRKNTVSPSPSTLVVSVANQCPKIYLINHKAWKHS